MSPPLKASTSVTLWASLSAFAAAAASPRTNVSAVGPSSTAFSASAPALSAARSVSEFFTTAKVASAARSFARRSATWLTVIPR